MKNNKSLESVNRDAVSSLTVGHLYFHKKFERVERITEVHSYGVVAHRHHDEKRVSLTRDFRKATAEEVKAYLGK